MRDFMSTLCIPKNKNKTNPINTRGFANCGANLANAEKSSTLPTVGDFARVDKEPLAAGLAERLFGAGVLSP
jgi:hypothetical protein